MEISKEKMDRLTMMSKSRTNTALNCMWGFKLAYVDELPSVSNFAMDRGTAVHKFHDDFFKQIKVVEDNGQSTLHVGRMDYRQHTDYKKSIINHYIEKWHTCTELKPENPKRYFFPIVSEKMITIPELLVRGIPDYAVYDFDDEVVVAELKTGKPTAEKIANYQNDLVWAKLLCEHTYPAWGQINKGEIYFPYNNHVEKTRITDQEVDKLLRVIENARQEIINMNFIPKPNKERCAWCNYKDICEHKVV